MRCRGLPPFISSSPLASYVEAFPAARERGTAAIIPSSRSACARALLTVYPWYEPPSPPSQNPSACSQTPVLVSSPRQNSEPPIQEALAAVAYDIRSPCRKISGLHSALESPRKVTTGGRIIQIDAGPSRGTASPAERLLSGNPRTPSPESPRGVPTEDAPPPRARRPHSLGWNSRICFCATALPESFRVDLDRASHVDQQERKERPKN